MPPGTRFDWHTHDDHQLESLVGPVTSARESLGQRHTASSGYS